MARADIKSILYSREKSPLQFKFDMLMAPNMYTLISVADVQRLHYIASSLKYASDINLKYKMIDEVLVPRGFKRFGCGTNRVVYKYLEDQSFLLKVAIDRVGLSDNPAEYKNQFLLQPFVTKVFQVSPCGTVALVERVQPITSHEEFAAVGEDIYDLLVNCIIGKYVLDDIGSKCFMNYGFRNGFGPVLLDYTYVYKLDGSKLQCMVQDPVTGQFCGGEIDYDDGFNNLVCTKCHRKYTGKELEEKISQNLIYKKGRGNMLRVKVTRGSDVIIDTNIGQQEARVIKRQQPVVKVALKTNEQLHKHEKKEEKYKQTPVQQPVVEKSQYTPPLQEQSQKTINGDDFMKIASAALTGDSNLAEQMMNSMLNNQIPNKEEVVIKEEVEEVKDEQPKQYTNKQPEKKHTTQKTVHLEPSKYNVSSTFIPEPSNYSEEELDILYGRGGKERYNKTRANRHLEDY